VGEDKANGSYSTRSDLAQIGWSPETRRVLQELKDAGHCNDALDGYRLAVAVACAYRLEPRLDRREGAAPRTTAYNASAVDTADLSLRTAITEIFPAAKDVPYRAIEDLAEQGTEILAKQMEGDNLSFSELIAIVEDTQKA